MPGITLDLVDAAELAEVLTFLTQWLSGSQKHALAGSFAAFVGHPATPVAHAAPHPAAAMSAHTQPGSPYQPPDPC